MRYPLRRALSLNFVDGATHNPTIGDSQSPAFQEREADSFGKKKACIEQTAKPKFLDLAPREPRGFLSCSVDVTIVRLESEQFNATLDHIAHILVDQFQCAQTDRD